MPLSQAETDRALAELEAMRAVASALAPIQDVSARARILEWARAHFVPAGEGPMRLTDGSQDMPMPLGTPARGGDFSALSVGDDWFEPTVAQNPQQPLQFVPVEHGFEPREDSWRRSSRLRNKVESQFRELKRAARRLAFRWQRAS